jgi:serine/threonine protein phosphatase PrpC
LAQKYSLKGGSTLLFSVVQDGKVSIANLGDSCGYMLKKSGDITKVTYDQTPERREEKERIQN